MIDKVTRGIFITLFPQFKNLELRLQEQFYSNAIIKSIPQGAFILNHGDSCQFLPLLLSGTIRIYKVNEQGREITFYKVGPGESCIITTTCILNEHNFPVEAVVEEDLNVILIPSDLIRKEILNNPVWQQFVFQLFSSRLTNLIQLVDNIVFKPIQVRIAEYLLQKSDKNGNVLITQQDLAAALGTSREVVSRSMKKMENSEILTLKRGGIKVLDLDKLKEIINKNSSNVT